MSSNSQNQIEVVKRSRVKPSNPKPNPTICFLLIFLPHLQTDK